MTDPTVTCVAECDQHAVPCATSSERVVRWMIDVPNAASQTDRLPLNLALVLDRSGSMQGEKLHCVQQAAGHVLSMLDVRDRVALVVYDDRVNLLAPSTIVTDAARQQLQAQIAALTPGGMTDLGGGWLAGCQQIGGELEHAPLRRALLLTDGLANRGITDVEVLQGHAAELRRRGVTTSTFGVGRDFNEHLLEGLATQGGGHFYYIAQPSQIADVFRSELAELLTVMAREAVLTINVPVGVEVAVLGDLPYEQTAGQLRVLLGDLYAGQQHAVFVRVRLPTDVPGTSVLLAGTLAYADRADRAVVVEAGLSFWYADEAAVLRSPIQVQVLQQAHTVELAATTTRVLQLDRAGQSREAQAVLQQALNACGPNLPAPALEAYQRLGAELDVGLTEDQRKQIHYVSYRARYQRT